MHDFELNWRKKLSGSIETRAGAAARESILPDFAAKPNPDEDLELIEWTREIIGRMESTLDIQTCQCVMADCACHYLQEQLEPLQKLFERTGDLQRVHQALQDQFERFLRDTLNLEEAMIAEVIDLGWGAAGQLKDDRIIATKIPKSGYLREYLQEPDPEVRRAIYCHCPRVQNAVEAGEELSQLYCYCGAGFYKHMWETILQSAVQVEILESVISGGDVCKVAIILPTRV